MRRPDQPFYVTTPIYYVNGTPHIGHAYTTILADVLTRYHRLFGDETYFLTGTDEHGLKVEEAAEAEGMEPKPYCDRMVTDPDHITYVQEVLQQLYEEDQIYSAPYTGWYCVPDERFWTEKDLVDGKCPECGREVVELEEENYFFKMGQYREWLMDHIETHPGFIFPETRRNEVLGFLRQGLGDLCISRPKSRLGWGIPLPFDEEYVTYVWFDALLNYVSAVRGGERPDDGVEWWPATLHLIGKDIVTTHCVYWPTMLKAAGLELPERIAAHGWWLVEEEKMSKSRGNVVQPLDLAERYGVDAFRYFLMREMSVGQDRSFSEVDMVSRYNSDLANDLGNALNRVTKMVGRYREGVLRNPGPLADEPEAAMQEACREAPARVRGYVEALAPGDAVDAALELVRATNRYLERREPWQLAKDEEQGDLLDAVLYTSAETLRIAAVLLSPVMPRKTAEMLTQLGKPPEEGARFEDLTAWGLLQPGDEVPGGEGLFPRAELPEELQS